MIPYRFALALSALAFCAPHVHAAPEFLDDAAESSTNVSWEMPRPTTAQTLVFDYKDAKNFYALDLTPANATFSRTVAGAKKIINSAPVKWDAKNQIVLQRRPWLMQLVVDDDIALRGFDASFDAGKIGAAPASWGELRVQPLDEVRFDDDFTRIGGEGDDLWKTTGKWQLSTSSEHISTRNANMSSNPFAFQVVSPNAESLATTGRWFWDSYDARAAVRPGGAGQIGLAAYVKDAKNYLAFRWSSQEGENARQLVRVTDGKATVLAQGKGAFLPRQWYKIGIRTSPGYIEAIVDGVPVLRAANEALGQGGVGLWAKNMDAAEFDDVQVRSYDFLRTAFSNNGAWEKATGDWKLAGGVAAGQNDGLLVTGARNWDGYRAHLSAQIKPGATIGYAVGVRDAKNYTAFQISPDKKARIVRVVNGAKTTLFEGNADLSAQTDKDGFARFQIDARNGRLARQGGRRTHRAGERAQFDQRAFWSARTRSHAGRIQRRGDLFPAAARTAQSRHQNGRRRLHGRLGEFERAVAADAGRQWSGILEYRRIFRRHDFGFSVARELAFQQVRGGVAGQTRRFRFGLSAARLLR